MPPEPGTPLDFADRVRVRTSDETVAAGVAGRLGLVYGITNPSMGYVTDPIVGQPGSDFAINVEFDDGASVWFAPELLELIDHAPGMTAVVGGVSFVRRDDGSWERSDQ